MNTLVNILRSKRLEIDELRRSKRVDELERAAIEASPVRGFATALRKGSRTIIAEIKRVSPSRGVIADDISIPVIAQEYAAGGAAALSVLTDSPFFGGSDQDLRAARGSCSLPVLRKDFVLDERQVVESRAMGADAILLIVRILNDAELHRLFEAAKKWSMDILVETHTEQEIERANRLGASIIGINNRDLESFKVDLSKAERMRSLIRVDAIAVAESGIRNTTDAHRMFAAGFDALLVGEGIVRSGDRAQTIRTMRNPDHAGTLH